MTALFIISLVCALVLLTVTAAGLWLLYQQLNDTDEE
jgi:hypothetical protein